MGCDIHLYVEYRAKDRAASPDPFMRRFSSFGSRINPGRIYEVFAAIAGVRAGREDQIKHQPRGLPTDIGFYSGADATLYITEKGDGYRECKLSDAEKWVAQGSSAWVEQGKRVTHPYWHSHSWLTFEEFRDAIHPIVCVKYKEPEYRALLAAMKQLHDDGYEVRVVFWFDN